MKCLTWIRTLVAAWTVMLVLSAPAWSQEDVTVFAAASLQNALEEVARQYQQKAGRNVRFSFAASSALARQIEQGDQPPSSSAPTNSGWTISRNAN